MPGHATRPAFSVPADQPVLPFLGAPERLLVAGEQSGEEFSLFESSGVRGHASPRHRHLRASETFVVLEGEILVEAGGQERMITPGSAAVLPRDVPHGFVVVSATARYLTLHTPSGFDAFVREVSAAARNGAAPDRATLVDIAAAHGIEILGPGPSFPPRPRADGTARPPGAQAGPRAASDLRRLQG